MAKKRLAKLASAFLSLLIALSAVVIIYACVSVNDKSIFGYRLFIIETDSMKGTLNAGDLIITKKVPEEMLKPGDIITFYSPDPSILGRINTHKIVSKTSSGYITRGVANPEDDKFPVNYNRVIGEKVFHSAILGRIIGFISKPLTMLLLIILPIIILCAIDITKIARRLKKASKEQADGDEMSEQEVTASDIIQAVSDDSAEKPENEAETSALPDASSTVNKDESGL